MIIPAHPDKPGNLGLLHLGYWRPNPPRIAGSMADEWAIKAYEKNKHLPDPHDFVDEAWDPVLRSRVVAYLQAGKAVEHWRGWSYCRFGCDARHSDMGSQDLSDGTYCWPQGFPHYVEHHGVRPPEEFVAHVLKVCRAPGCSHDPPRTRWDVCPR